MRLCLKRGEEEEEKGGEGRGGGGAEGTGAGGGLFLHDVVFMALWSPCKRIKSDLCPSHTGVMGWTRLISCRVLLLF